MKEIGFTEGRRAACAKAQRCGKAELGVWESRGVRGAPRAGVSGGQLRGLHPRPQGSLGWAWLWDPYPPPPWIALAGCKGAGEVSAGTACSCSALWLWS